LHTLQQVSLRRMCWVGPLVAAGLLASIPFLFFIGDLLPG
jgi:hypothetical protein